ncbi:MAG: DUF1634 domain-containing protein [Deltaproteobacteria bacterium]|nr:DUF1634 domain-containing protein [Deltaproteobacteria bacterium]
MTGNEKYDKYVTQDQLRYASVLGTGMYLGLLALLITFVIYTLGILTPYIPLDKLSACWHIPAAEYLQSNNIPDGWGWVRMLGYGDFLNFIGIVMLAGTTIICYMAVVPALFKNRDYIYAAIAVLEVVVLVVAASGVIAVGGH